MTLSDFCSRIVALSKKVATDTQVHVGKEISEAPEKDDVWEYFDIISDVEHKRIIIAPSGRWDRTRRES